MPRRRRPFTRESEVRDARLIIIATEDTKATVSYFQGLASPNYYQNSKIHVEVLLRDHYASSPEYVLEQLNNWINKYEFTKDDELWIVIDVDRWKEAKLSDVARKCQQKGFLLAVNNPDIELWFLLHLVNVHNFTQQQKEELFANKKVNTNRTRMEQEIIKIIGSYNKGNLDVDQFLPHVKDAIERAERLDTNPDDRWPQALGTRVYLLARSIIGD